MAGLNYLYVPKPLFVNWCGHSSDFYIWVIIITKLEFIQSSWNNNLSIGLPWTGLNQWRTIVISIFIYNKYCLHTSMNQIYKQIRMILTVGKNWHSETCLIIWWIFCCYRDANMIQICYGRFHSLVTCTICFQKNLYKVKKNIYKIHAPLIDKDYQLSYIVEYLKLVIVAKIYRRVWKYQRGNQNP